MIDYQPVIQNLALHPGYVTDVLRLDLVHPEISGNKWFKLKKNLEAAAQQDKTTILTFGGAFSNHIAATAAACKLAGLNSIGVIRSEETALLNPTLKKAKEEGMTLHFVSREEYARKEDREFIRDLSNQFGSPYIIPEGGNNREGILGCTEILKPEWNYDYVFCACGTGATYAGITVSAKPHIKVIGISVLKGTNTLVEDVNHLLKDNFRDRTILVAGNETLNGPTLQDNCIINTYCFNGYAKYDSELVQFKKQFDEKFSIPLDHVYTAKLFYAVNDLIEKRKLLPGVKALIIHSGGLQGNAGFEERYKL